MILMPGVPGRLLLQSGGAVGVIATVHAVAVAVAALMVRSDVQRMLLRGLPCGSPQQVCGAHLAMVQTAGEQTEQNADQQHSGDR